MQKLKVELKNCYGISNLEHTFDFSDENQNAIYAPNGVMKSSLARTFKDQAEENPSEDRIYPTRETVRSITDENDIEISSQNIFVVEPYDETYKSGRVSTLLVNKKLREEYEEVYSEIYDKKNSLVSLLAKASGIKKNADEVLSNDIASDPKDFFLAMGRLKADLENSEFTHLEDIKYSEIFNAKTEKLLNDPEFRKSLEDYMAIYDRLTGESTFFRKGVFNHNNASDVAKNLKSNGFFDAEHSVYVNNKDVRQEIKNEKDLEKIIQSEKETILEDSNLLEKFEKLDNLLKKNVDLKKFRTYLDDNSKIIPELQNSDRMKQRLWASYLKQEQSSYDELMDANERGKIKIQKIVQEARKESTMWAEVIRIFNERFSVPFLVTMENQSDVILNLDAPSVKFRFQDSRGDEVAVDEQKLLQVLSNGEKRALYILNIIFEVIARQTENIETLFIFDDIADSFDYKNKYAIIEYLKDVSKISIFNQLILSHNFDFFRTVCSRLYLDRKNKYHVIKNAAGIFLKQEKYQNNPFAYWKKSIPLGNNDEFLIATIPFLRNLAEYTDDKTTEEQLTKYLHVKKGSKELTVSDLETILKSTINYTKPFTLPHGERKVFELIFSLATDICNFDDEQIELEHKIILAIAIRLKTEIAMILAISDENAVEKITKNQTSELLNIYKQQGHGNPEKYGIIEQVNLMTPENIHINSFMYEPILDMSNEHLKRLLNKVETL